VLESILQSDEALFLALNQLHHPLLDAPMRFITGTLSWIPFYVGILVWLWFRMRRKSIKVMLCIVVLILAADQISSGLMKPGFARLRPCHEPHLSSQVHLIAGCGGSYGFVSSHAANTFALATFLVLLSATWPERRKVWWIMLPWAFLVSYSRIYAGVHYPADVAGGALLGILLAWLLYWLAKKYTKIHLV
jgi:undecaprenyl-diphosphatase